MKLILTRTKSNAYFTAGKLEIFSQDGDDLKSVFKCFTAELPDLNNAKEKSCINKGTYWLSLWESEKFGSCLYVNQFNILLGKIIKDINTLRTIKFWDEKNNRYNYKVEVESEQTRSAILIHAGNYINCNGKTDSRGCILVGDKQHITSESLMIENSKKTLAKIYDIIKSYLIGAGVDITAPNPMKKDNYVELEII